MRDLIYWKNYATSQIIISSTLLYQSKYILSNSYYILTGSCVPNFIKKIRTRM